MDYFLELFIGGLTRGSIYALIALGYTMVYGIIELINFAHGEIYMIGAFTALIIASVLAMSGMSGLSVLILASVVAVIYSAAYGVHRRENRLQASAPGSPPFASDQRHRHVHLPAELRPAGPDVGFSALPESAARSPVHGAIRRSHRLNGIYNNYDYGSYHGPPDLADQIHEDGESHAGYGPGQGHGHAGRRECQPCNIQHLHHRFGICRRGRGI